jgi:hypothetical protein
MVKENEKGLKTMDNNATQIKIRFYNEIYSLKFTEVEEGNLYLFGEEFGPTVIIKTSSIEDAYEEYITEYLVPCDRAWEAYGIYKETVYNRYCDLLRSNSAYHANLFLKRYKALYDKKERIIQIDLSLKSICMREPLPLIEGYDYDAGGEIKNISEYLWVNVYDKTLKKWLRA